MPPRVLVAGPARLADYLRPYRDALRWAGAEPVLAWPAELGGGDADPRRCLAGFAGLLLPGGVDVEPHRYGELPRPELGATDVELDEGQLALADLALAEGLPTLAICRGIQVLAVAAGGALYQDLPTQRPDSALAHRPPPAAGSPPPPDFLAHEVVVATGSRLAALAGATRFPVNSRHHQAAREADASGFVGPLRVVARATDGVVEGLELSDHPCFLGVQWHPENLLALRGEARGLLRGFVAACRHATCGRAAT